MLCSGITWTKSDMEFVLSTDREELTLSTGLFEEWTTTEAEGRLEWGESCLQVTMTWLYCASHSAVSHCSVPGHPGHLKSLQNTACARAASSQLWSKTFHSSGSGGGEGPVGGEGRRAPLQRSLASSLGCIEDHKPSTGLVGVTEPPHTGPCEPSSHHCTVVHQLKGEWEPEASVFSTGKNESQTMKFRAYPRTSGS